MSLKKTVSVARIKPAPIVNINNSIRGITLSSMYKVNGAFVTIITMKRTIIESRNVTRLENVTASGYMYLGTYNFLIIDAFVIIEFKAALVAPA